MSENDLPIETQQIMEKKLSVVQRELIDYLRFRDNSPKGRILHRFDGGFWASKTEKLGPCQKLGAVKAYRVPMRYWPTGTIMALAERGVLVAQERQDGGGRLHWMDYTLAEQLLVADPNDPDVLKCDDCQKVLTHPDEMIERTDPYQLELKNKVVKGHWCRSCYKAAGDDV